MASAGPSQGSVQSRCIVVRDGVKHEVIREMMMEAASSIEQASDLAIKKGSRKKPRITAIPEGPFVIPSV